MHKREVVSQVHRMGRLAKPKTLKVPPLTEVKALTRSPDTNISLEISLTLRRYWGDIRCEKSLLILPIIQWISPLPLSDTFDDLIALEKFTHKILFQGTKS
jgi:hypothetical protein